MYVGSLAPPATGADPLAATTVGFGVAGVPALQAERRGSPTTAPVRLNTKVRRVRRGIGMSLALDRSAEYAAGEVALQERIDAQDRDHGYHDHCHLNRLQWRCILHGVSRPRQRRALRPATSHHHLERP